MPSQREVVEVQFRLPPDGKLLNHPVIVISNDDINQHESGFIGVMMTSEESYKGDEYSFELSDDMFTKPLGKKFSAVRLHLIGNFINKDIIKNGNSGNQIKKTDFNRLMVNINNTTFNLTNFRI